MHKKDLSSWLLRTMSRWLLDISKELMEAQLQKMLSLWVGEAGWDGPSLELPMSWMGIFPL